MLSIRALCALLLLLATCADATKTLFPRFQSTDSSNSYISPSTAYLRRSTRTGELIPVPTPQILAWQAREISVLIHFNLATYLDVQFDGCNSQLGLVPNVSLFTPFQLSTDQWVQSMEALGAKGAVLVVKHNCGFTTWPTQVRFKTLDGVQRQYDYAIQHSPVEGFDVAGAFINSSSRAGIATGFYYSVVSNNWMNIAGGVVQNGSNAAQVNVSQATYEQVVLDQVTELWTRYGQLGEIWFDGGIRSEWRNSLSQLITKHQPDAAIFNGCVDESGPTESCVSQGQSVRWIGEEDGYAPDPNWSTGVTNDGGQANSTVFCPAECDTTLQENDRWFWGVNQQLRPLSELVDVYHYTVGRNCLLQMDLTPDTNGLIPARYAARYAQLGGLIRACYVDQLLEPSVGACNDDGTCEYVFNQPVSVDRVVLMEDQRQGQVIRNYTVRGYVVGSAAAGNASGSWQQLSAGTSVGHKKIDLFDAPVTVNQVRVTVEDAADTPVWASIRLHICDQITADAIRLSEELDAQIAMQ